MMQNFSPRKKSEIYFCRKGSIVSGYSPHSKRIHVTTTLDKSWVNLPDPIEWKKLWWPWWWSNQTDASLEDMFPIQRRVNRIISMTRSNFPDNEGGHDIVFYTVFIPLSQAFKWQKKHLNKWKPHDYCISYDLDL